MDQVLHTQLMKHRHNLLLHQHFIHKSIKGHLNIDFFLAEVKQEGSGMKDVGPVGWSASQSRGATAGRLTAHSIFLTGSLYPV